MELIYSVVRNVKNGNEVPKDENILCRLSSKNIVAFSTSVTLGIEPRSRHEYGNRVYVCDINAPWDYYPVDTFPDKVTALEWHPCGLNLLILTDTGRCLVYQMKDFEMNNWECKHRAEVTGERFIAAAWFAQPHRVVLNGDKRESISYTEKITRERCVPPLQQYGGRTVNGWVAVTSSSLVVVGVSEGEQSEMSVESACLGALRSKCTVADIDFDMSTGHILLATSNGSVASAVASYRVALSSEGDLHSLHVTALAGFFTKSGALHTDARQPFTSEVTISHVRFMSTETGKALIVAVGNSKSSQLELWAYRKQDLTLHSSFSKLADVKRTRGCWVYQSSVTHASIPVAIAIPIFPVQYGNLDPTGKLFQCVAVAYKDGSMKIVSKPSFQAVSTTNLDMGFNDVDRAEKRRKVAPCIVSMQQTFTGCGLVGIDQFGCMYMMKVVNTRDTVTQVPPHYLVAMLEYLTMSGHDCWDLLIALKPGVIEQVIQRFVDNFGKQPAVIQELVYARHMAFRCALYRCSPAAQQRSADCHCRLMLHLISTHFKSLLQPKALSAQDAGPAEKLNLNCMKGIEGDIDKVMMTLNPAKKEFSVEERTLQAIQPHIQWVADLTLYLLTSLQGYGNSLAGYSLLHDAAVLCCLRELLVLIRLWTVIYSRPLLHFTTTTPNLDPLLEMFKILTKVWQVCKEGKGPDYDDALLDKCVLLQSQIYSAQHNSLLLGNLNFSGSLLLQNMPLKYMYGEVPNHVLEASRGHDQCVDMVHLTHLGVEPAERARACVRCEGMTCVQDESASAAAGVAAVRAWQGKWTRGCMCGGHWKRAALTAH